MADNKELENLSSSMAALTKQIEKQNAAMLLGQDTIENQNESTEEILTNVNNINKAYDKQKGTLREIAGNMADMLKSTMKVGSVLGSLGTTMFAANLVKDMIDLDDQMTALSVRMGKGHAGIKELKGSVASLQAEFGTSYENAKMLVSELAKEKYIGNIRDAAAGIDLMSRASGVSNDQVLELTNNLSKMGGLSTSSINSMYAGMIKVQQKVGISEKGMTALVATIQDMSANMVAFGKTSSEIKRMAVETTALVGAMEKVGISAQRSTELVNQLTDPDRIEDNILLYSQLGVSMEDALSGNVDIGSLDGQLKEMADRVVAMGPIAGSQFAKSMGLSYKEVSRMAKMQAGEAEAIAEEALTPEEQALDVMKSLEASTEGIGKRFETGLNKLEGRLKQLPTSILIGIAILAPLLVRQAKKIFHKIFDKKEMQASVEDAVVPSMANGFKIAGEKIKGGVNSIGNIIKGNVKEWFSSKGIGGAIYGIDKRVEAAYKRATKGSIIDKIYGASKQNLLDDLNAKMVQIEATTEGVSSKFSELGVDISKFKGAGGSIDVEAMNSAGVLGGDKKQADAIKALVAQYNKLNQEKQATNMLMQKEMGLKAADLQKIQKLEKFQSNWNKQKEKMVNLESQLNERTSSMITKQKELEEIKKAANNLDGEAKKLAIARMNALEQEIKEAASGTEIMVKELEALKKEGIDDKIKNIATEIGKVKNEAKEAAKELSPVSKLLGSIGNKIKGKWRNSGLGQAVNGAIASATPEGGTLTGKQKFGAGLKGGLKFVGVKALIGIGKGILGGVKKVGGAIKNVLKSIGPMALVGMIFGKLLQKIQEPLEVMIDQIVEKMSPLIKKLLPIIEKLMNVVATKLLPPLLKFAAQALKILHAILTPVQWILKALSHLPMLGGFFKGVSEVLEDVTGEGTQEALLEAADSLSDSSFKIEKTSENMDEAAEKEGEGGGPKVYEATGATFTYKGGGTQAAADSSVSSNNVTTSKSSEELLNESKKEKADNNNASNMENISENTGVLPRILSLLENLVENITKEDYNFMSKDQKGLVVE